MKAFLAIFFLTLLLLPVNVSSQSDCVRLDFHFLEIENVLYSPKLRHIDIFLDEKAFTEENLKKMFRFISDKNPEPNYLTVEVKTDWRQLPLPSDCPPFASTNMPERLDKFDYHQAIFYRRGEKEYFNYNPILKTDDFKRVVVKNK